MKSLTDDLGAGGAVPGGERELNDAAMAVLALARANGPTDRLFRSVAAGRALLDINLSDDLPVCAEVDRHDLVPVMVDRVIKARD